MAGWFNNLKKWQKGGLIGCAVGLLFACLLMLSLILDLEEIVWKWITYLHASLYVISEAIIPFRPFRWVYYGFSGAIVVFYGGFGALMGRIQQVTSPFSRWLLTGLLALFLLLFHGVSFIIGMLLEHA